MKIKKFILIFIVIILLLILVMSQFKDYNVSMLVDKVESEMHKVIEIDEDSEIHFEDMEIMSITDGFYMVRPLTGGNGFYIPIEHMKCNREPLVGEKLRLMYLDAETGSNGVEKIWVINEIVKDIETTKGTSKVPMVNINGVKYKNTGARSEVEGETEGKILSSVSNMSEPEKEDQSNFGVGYEYRNIENHIEVKINNYWYIFDKCPEKIPE